MDALKDRGDRKAVLDGYRAARELAQILQEVKAEPSKVTAVSKLRTAADLAASIGALPLAEIAERVRKGDVRPQAGPDAAAPAKPLGPPPEVDEGD